MKTALQIILAIIFLTSALQAQEKRSPKSFSAPDLIALTHVSVVDVVRGRLKRDHTVIVSKDRISAVGPSNDVPIPGGAVIIDGKGKYLVPGFADMHVHLYTEGDVLTYIANGITTVRNMAGDATHLEFRRRVASGEMIGPRIRTAGPVIETGSLSHPDNVLLTDSASAWREVERQSKAGYDFIKVYNEMSPDVYAAVTAAAKKFNMAVVGHVPFEVGLENALKAPQASIEHLRGYQQELLAPTDPTRMSTSFRDRSVAWNSVNASLMNELAKRTAEAGVWNCPTLVFSVHELSPYEEHARLLKRPEVEFLSLQGLPDRTKNQGYLSDFTDRDFAATQRGLTSQFRLLRKLDSAGAGILVGTDSWLAGYAYVDELELLVRAGFTPARVLRMATFDAARFFGEADQWGAIEPGRRADVVLLDGNPLHDIANARQVRVVITNGRLLHRNDLDALLKELPRSKTPGN